MQKLTMDSHLLRSKDLVAANMDGDTVMMSIESGHYFGIGGIGSRVWELLEFEVTLSDLMASILNEYEIDEEACLNDLSEFISKLAKEGLVRIY